MPLDADAALTGVDRNIIGAHVALGHVAVSVELPMFVAVSAIPLQGVDVLPLIFEPDRNAIVGIGPEFFHEFVVLFSRPFAFKEIDDCSVALKGFVSIAPDAIG